ncbi:MAG: hypothetical protein ACT4QC_09660 [Planctomycetaceae bacterium]
MATNKEQKQKQKKKARERRVAQEKIAADQQRAKQQHVTNPQKLAPTVNTLMAAVTAHKTNYVAADVKDTFARRRSVG